MATWSLDMKAGPSMAPAAPFTTAATSPPLDSSLAPENPAASESSVAEETCCLGAPAPASPASASAACTPAGSTDAGLCCPSEGGARDPSCCLSVAAAASVPLAADRVDAPLPIFPAALPRRPPRTALACLLLAAASATEPFAVGLAGATPAIATLALSCARKVYACVACRCRERHKFGSRMQ